MHVSDGILPPAVWAPCLAAAGAAVAVASSRFDEKRIPEVAVLTAVFFVAALIHVPLGWTSIHLSLTGLLGIILGWQSVPAIFVALLFQRLFLGHGGLTTLGVNTITMGAGSIVSFLIFGALRRPASRTGWTGAASFAASAGGTAVSSIAFLALMSLGGRELERVAMVCLLPNAILAVLEGFVTAATVSFLQRTRPELVEPRAIRAGSSRRAGGEPAALSKPGMFLVGAAACGLALLPGSASAHSLEAAARIIGNEVRIEAFFSDDTPARGARVTVRERGSGSDGASEAGTIEAGTIEAEGETDSNGWFRFVPRRAADLVVTVEDAAGHRAEMTIRAADIAPAALPPSAPQPGPNAPVIASSEGAALRETSLWLRAGAGILGIALVAGAAFAALRWRRRRAG